MQRSRTSRTRRTAPRYLPSIEIMEAREMLSASPAPRAVARAWAIGPAVETAGVRLDSPTRAALVTSNQAHWSPLKAGSWTTAKLDREYVLALRSKDVNAWRTMLATVRAQDRPAWRGIVRAVQAGSPRAWSQILSAFRTHFPGTPGIPEHAPGETGAATSTPSLALPLGPNFDLGTRWSVIQSDSNTEYLNPPVVSMSPDSTVWGVFAPNTQALYQYDPQGQAWYKVWDAPGAIASISAGQINSFWGGRSLVATYIVDGVANVAILSTADDAPYGTYMSSRTMPIPGSPSYAQVASTQLAGSSGPFWILADGRLYQYTGTAQNPGWVALSTGGLNITQITVVASGDLWAIAKSSGAGASDQAYQMVDGTWQAGPALADLANLAGTGDGTLWARTTGGGLYTLSSDHSQWVVVTSTSALPGQNPTITDVVTPSTYTGFAAGSKYRAAAASPTSGVQLLTYGLADQPPSGYPAMDAGEQAGYVYINQYLGVTATGGIRSLYQNEAAVLNLAGYQSDLFSLTKAPVPSTLHISLSDWQAITKEIYNEVFSVVAVYDYFVLVDGLTGDIGGKATNLLSNTSQQVQLSKDKQNSIFDVILGQLFSAALGGIVKAFSGGAGVAASLIASAISDGIADATKNQSNQNYALNYYELSTTLYNIFNDAGATNSALRTAILSDPNRFLPFGVGVTSNTIQWPDDKTDDIAAKTLNAFQSTFLQVLTPLAWPIYYATDYPASELSCWPSYTSYFQPDSAASNSGTLYVLGTPGTFGFDFPDQKRGLLSTIESVTGATQAAVLTNQLGWFKPIEKSSFFMLAFCMGPPPADAVSTLA